MLINYFQLYANHPVEHKYRAESVKNSVTFARSSVERHANIKINESQVFSMRDAFFVAFRGQFISRVHVQLTLTPSKTSDFPNTLESFRKR